MGEGVLRSVKRNIPSVQNNWHISLTNKFYQNQSITRSLNPVDTCKNIDSGENDVFSEIFFSYLW